MAGDILQEIMGKGIDPAIIVARKNFWAFCQYMNHKFFRDDRPHLKELADTLQALYERRLINPKTSEPYDIGKYANGKPLIDCDYGSKTAEAVKVEQSHIGLAQTGNADIVTIAHIIAHAAGDTAPTTTQHILVTGGTVYIRTGAGASYSFITVVKTGDRFEATGQTKNGWYEIWYTPKGKPEIKAWISGKYAEIVE